MTGSVDLKTPIGHVRRYDPMPGKTIREIFAGIDFPPVPVVAALNGQFMLRAEWDLPTVETDVLEFITPHQGGGSKDILRLVTLVALAVAAPGIGTAIAGEIGIATGTGLFFGGGFAIGGVSAGTIIGGAVLIGGSLAINALFAPGAPGAGEQASPTYSINAQGNSARLGQVIPKQYGRFRIFPDFAAQPYSRIEGNDQILYCVFCLGVGRYDVEEIRVDDTAIYRNGVYTESFKDMDVHIYNPGDQVTAFHTAVQTSVEVSAQELNTQYDLVGPYVVCSPGSVVQSIEFDLVSPKGLVYIDDKGKLTDQSISFQIDIQQIDDYGLPLSDWAVLDARTYVNSTQNPLRHSTLGYNVTPARYQVRIRRTSAHDTNPQNFWDLSWAGLRGFIPDDNTFADETIMVVSLRATAQLSAAASRRFNVIQTARIPVWNGSDWVDDQLTRSIAWAAADILRNPVYGAGLPDSRIDVDKLLELDAIWTSRGDTFDGVFDTSRTIWQALSDVLKVGRAQPAQVAGVVTFSRTQPQSIASGVFTPANTRTNSFNATYILSDDDTPDDIIVDFVDERTWQSASVECVLPDSQSQNSIHISGFGIANIDQAYREGMYLAAANKYQRLIGSLSTEMEGKLLLKGNTVIVHNDASDWGQSGQVLDFDGSVFSLTEAIDWGEQNYGFMKLSQRNNQEFGPFKVYADPDNDFVAVADPAELASAEVDVGLDILQVLSLGGDADYTRFVFGWQVAGIGKTFVVSGVSYQGFDTSTIQIVNDDPRVHSADGTVPPVTVPGTHFGTPEQAPAVTSVIIASGSPANHVTISWGAVTYATSYIVDISYDGVAWTNVYSGSGTSVAYVLDGGTAFVRVAAVNVYRGPYKTVSGTFGAAITIPLDPASITASASTGAITASWSASAGATFYRFQIVVSSVIEFTQDIPSTATTIDSATIATAGGPWLSATAQVAAGSPSGLSGFATTSVTYDVPSGFLSLDAGGTGADLSGAADGSMFKKSGANLTVATAGTDYLTDADAYSKTETDAAIAAYADGVWVAQGMPVPSSGSFTATTNVSSRKIGPAVTVSGSLSISSVGSSGGAIKIPLSHTPALSGSMDAFNASTGVKLVAYVNAGDPYMYIYANAGGYTSPIAAASYYVAGTYECA